MKLWPGGAFVHSFVHPSAHPSARPSVCSLAFARSLVSSSLRIFRQRRPALGRRLFSGFFFAGAFRFTSNVCPHRWEPVDQNRNCLRPQPDQEILRFRPSALNFLFSRPFFSGRARPRLAIAPRRFRINTYAAKWRSVTRSSRAYCFDIMDAADLRSSR